MKEVTLYSKDNAGKVLIWTAKLLPNNNLFDLQICHGQYEGVMQFEWEKYIKPKNVGRTNETTPLKQAQSRLKSRVNVKKRKGYIELSVENEAIFQSLPEEDRLSFLNNTVPQMKTDLEGHVKPMLANHYFRSKKSWFSPDGRYWKDRKYYYLKNPHVVKEEGAIVPKFPCYGQPKINGVRATIFYENGEVLIKSRDGKRYYVPHIEQWAKEVFKKKYTPEEIVFDGELYIYGESLQNIQSAVKSQDLNTSRVIYIVYDLAIENYTNLERWVMLKNLSVEGHFFGSAELIRTWVLKNDEQVQKYCDRFIAEGHEGIILRDMNGDYGFGRRRNTMVKLKRTISHDFKIIGIEGQPKKPNLALFVCIHKGNTFKVTPMMTEAESSFIKSHPNVYIGKKLQCTFYEWTDEDKPYHIMETVIRDYE